ncbi:MAG: YheC/YheD family protein [Kyrpidia sp.]|nr:YheC/YheD family protein [Kyrpidia sp.]
MDGTGASDSTLVALPRRLASSLGMAPERTIGLRWGRWRGTARVHYSHMPPNTIELLGPWSDVPVRIRILPRRQVLQRDGALDLGPVMAVLIGAHSPERRRIPGLVHGLVRAGHRHGMVIYACYADDIDWHHGRAWGWSRREPGRAGWQWWPLPDVVYNRIAHRWEEELILTKQVKNEAKQRHISVFNSGFFDKWTTYRILVGDSALAPFQPKTERISGFDRESLASWMEDRRAFFVKPIHGSLGEGLILCEPHPGGWRVGVQQQGRIRRATLGPDRLLYKLSALAARKGYLLQERVELRTFQGRRVDFRVHVQNTRRGRWSVVAIAGKGAHPHALSTHVRFGGLVWPAKEVLGHWFGADADTWVERLGRLGCAVAERLERTSGGVFGEVGLDMGISVDGHLWLFEANAKPGHHIFAHPALRRARLEWARLVVDYAAGLSEAGKKGADQG